MTLTTVKDYCTHRGVSRQFVYEYIKKGKFEMLELPVFVELEGIKIGVGKQKFLKVPPQYLAEKKPYWSGDVSDSDYAHAMSKDATDDWELQKHLAHYLNLQTDIESEQYKNYLFETLFPIKHPKNALLTAAFNRCIQLMMAEMADLEQNVRRLEKR